MSIAVLLNTGRPAAMFSLRIWLIIWLCNFLQVRHLPVTCLAIFCTPTIRNACLIHRWDFCNCNVLAFRKGFSRVLINDLGRIMGLCISSGNDPMFSSLPCAHNTPCLSDAGISFLSTVYTLIVCQLHLNNHSLDSLNSSVKWCLFFIFKLVLLVNRRT